MSETETVAEVLRRSYCPNKVHQGRNIKRIREMLGIKQEALAIQLGEEWYQKRISLLEAKEELEPGILFIIAKALNIPEEVIRSFDEGAVVNYFQSADTSKSGGALLVRGKGYQNCSFNAFDKLIEVFEENKMLYERLLASEREKVEILKRPFQK